MKKIVCLMLTCFLLVGMTIATTACGGDEPAHAPAPAPAPDPEPEPAPAATAQVFVCGVTEYEPMNFREGGEWTGFDTEFALLVGDKLGLEIEFQMIDWAQKFTELNAGTIDAIWNGFTATALEPDGTPRMTLADMSYSYMLNTQCVIVKVERLDEFKSEADLEGKILAAEAGSAGDSEASDLVGETGSVIGVAQQINTFLEVMTGAADGAVIDFILADQLAGTGDFEDVAIAFKLADEAFAIAFRIGDPMRDKVNTVIKELYDEGILMDLAVKYGVEARLHVDTSFGQ